MKQALFKVNKCILIFFIDTNKVIEIKCYTINQARNYIARSKIEQYLNVV